MPVRLDELRLLPGLPPGLVVTSIEPVPAPRALHLINEIKQALGVR